MLNILIETDTESVLKKIRVSGHAGDAAKGRNIVCAAATSLIRSAYRTVNRHSEAETELDISASGMLDFEISKYDLGKKDWLKGVTDSLLTGLVDLDAEYPDHLEIKILKKY